jgi:DNA polymerase III alpha subunit (gram-positive type)
MSVSDFMWRRIAEGLVIGLAIAMFGALLAINAKSISSEEVRILIDTESPYIPDQQLMQAAVKNITEIADAVIQTQRDVAVVLEKVANIENRLTGAALMR